MRHGSEARALARAARTLGRAGPHGKAPRLALFTDPRRTPDLAAAIERLPRGAAVVYRAFGAVDAVVEGRALRRLTWRRGVTLLVGADARLAAAIRADGVHLPERLAHLAPRLKRRRPTWIITAAAHDLVAARRAARFGVDAVFVSPVFVSRSPSAGRPLGPLRLATIVRATPAPVHALGGVNGHTAQRLMLTGAAGLAAVEALASG